MWKTPWNPRVCHEMRLGPWQLLWADIGTGMEDCQYSVGRISSDVASIHGHKKPPF